MKKFTNPRTWICCFCLMLVILCSTELVHGAEFFCSSGDVTCLVAAINNANGISGAHTVNLEPGSYTLHMSDDGINGLPTISRSIRIRATAEYPPTVIERDPGATFFRIFNVSAVGELTLVGVTVQRGLSLSFSGPAILNRGVTSLEDTSLTDNIGEGGAIANLGVLKLVRSIIADNSLGHEGGGIHNDLGGSVLVENSTIAHNASADGGGVFNKGALVVKNSSIIDNHADCCQPGGGILNGISGSVEIIGSTIAKNVAGGFFGGGGGGVYNGGGVVSIINSTIRENRVSFLSGSGGGIFNAGGTLRLQNTIVAGNTADDPFTPAGPSDCFGIVTSVGNNLVGDPSGCAVNLAATDLTGDPGLGSLVGTGEDYAPGKVFYPVLPGSAVIDSGNPAVCPQLDQLETPRLGTCDIGAVEFYPLLNSLVTVGNVSTAFDSTPLPHTLAGTLHITAEFTNTSGQTILRHFAEVTELTGGNLLLNADGSPGGIGARLTSPNSESTPFLPGATELFQFMIGLQSTEPFTFFINLLGDATSF